MATDWTRAYGVDFEYWEVDPRTYNDTRRLYAVEECEITRDLSDDTLGGASMTLGEFLEQESYVRVYLVATQGVSSERVALGTFLALTPAAQMDGKAVERPLDLYTPLKELADDMPPVGYTVRKGDDAIGAAKRIFGRHHVKLAPCAAVAEMPADMTAGDSDSWLTFGRAVLAAVYMEPAVDAYGTVSFEPVRDASALAPRWTYADDEISILMPEAELECDWAGVPNVYEVTVSGAASTASVRCENDDPSSPVSTATRGRVVLARETNPEGVVNAELAASYARRKLRELSCAERRVTYTHGYCPVRLGDCVRVAYTTHQMDCKARVQRQVIRCRTDLEVEETASYTERLWNG